MKEVLAIVLVVGAIGGLVLFINYARLEARRLRAEVEDLERLRGPRVRPIGEQNAVTDDLTPPKV